MTITISDTKIDFGNFSIEVDPANTGIIIDGAVFGSEFNFTQMLGTVRGFATDQTTISQAPFASDVNLSDTGGDLTISRGTDATGVSSDTHGYIAGGGTPYSAPVGKQIDKFPFASFTNASVISDMDQDRYRAASVMSFNNGYFSGGDFNPIVPGAPFLNTIDKLPFVNDDAGAIDVGNLTVTRFEHAGVFSANEGYFLGGDAGPAGYNDAVEKFPFAVPEVFSVNSGELTDARKNLIAFSSENHGYETSGESSPAPTSPSFLSIRKFPYALFEYSENSVGDLTDNNLGHGSYESTTNGYVFGSTLERVNFATDTNSVLISPSNPFSTARASAQD